MVLDLRASECKAGLLPLSHAPRILFWKHKSCTTFFSYTGLRLSLQLFLAERKEPSIFPTPSEMVAPIKNQERAHCHGVRLVEVVTNLQSLQGSIMTSPQYVYLPLGPCGTTIVRVLSRHPFLGHPP